MYAYIKGIITAINSNSIVVETHGVGYLLLSPTPYKYHINQDVQIFTYHYVREDISQLFGFPNNEDKEFFLKLLSVKGIGPKGALAILASGNSAGTISAIEREDVTYLKKFPGIGPKAAQQIILDLKGKLVVTEEIITSNDNNEEVEEALLALGYSTKEVRRVTKQLHGEDLSLDEKIKKALQLMLK